MKILIAILFSVNFSFTYTTNDSIKDNFSGECGDYTAKVYEFAKQQIPETEIFFGVKDNPIPDGIYKVRIVPDIHNYLKRKMGKFYNYQNNKRIVLSSITTNTIYELYERVADVPQEYKNYRGPHVFPVIKENEIYKVFDACSGYTDQNGRRPSVFFDGKTQIND